LYRVAQKVDRPDFVIVSPSNKIMTDF